MAELMTVPHSTDEAAFSSVLPDIIDTLNQSHGTWVANILKLTRKFIQNNNVVEKPTLDVADFDCCNDAGRAHTDRYDTKASCLD